ncbi:MAG: hypothetical protein CL610_14675 [Anaerolineaceae bacterium]|nr:hypothetical protein [Anaerolineaceae bacterium]
MTIHIQPASINQAASIAQLKSVVWPDEMANAEQVAQALRQPDHRAFVALADQRVVGFVDAFPTTNAAGHTRWEIDLLAVHPAYQGQKIGQRLIEAAVQAGQPHPITSRALIQVDNHASQGAFRRCGFSPDWQVYQLMIATGQQAGNPQPLEQAVLIPVVTMNYSGLWLEGTFSAANLRAAQAECHRRDSSLVGALIPTNQAQALAAAETLGYAPIELFHWWLKT